MALVGAIVWWRAGGRGDPGPAFPIPGEIDTILVEVLNGTSVDGLARDVTRALRRAGIDVVYYGTAREGNVNTTRVLARRGDTAMARHVRDLVGVGQVTDAPDSDLLLDVTVVLGRDAASAIRN